MEDELDCNYSFSVDAHLFDHALTDIVASDSAVPSALPIASYPGVRVERLVTTACACA